MNITHVGHVNNTIKLILLIIIMHMIIRMVWLHERYVWHSF